MSGKLDVFYPLTFYDLLKNAFEHFMKSVEETKISRHSPYCLEVTQNIIVKKRGTNIKCGTCNKQKFTLTRELQDAYKITVSLDLDPNKMVAPLGTGKRCYNKTKSTKLDMEQRKVLGKKQKKRSKLYKVRKVRLKPDC